MFMTARNQVAGDAQQAFSGSDIPSFSRLLSAYEELMTSWENKGKDPAFAAISSAIQDGVTLLGKYYDATDESPLAVLSTSMHQIIHLISF
jgi:hypothetical protein